ncbi:MAG: phosphopantothenoylcysteine decarboxylase [Eubacteriales bacterium]|nr:phosphopantothenoylcysteine decarboxylase [Eubacteriales bacterium]MDD4390826.1 phosphopantothenoylcysteine decarboxylase [Eubacteriales bacterium]
MKIIITAGGTTEKIDEVRKITNTGTGKLGSIIAEEFVSRAGDRIEKIYYVCQKGTIVPKLDCLEEIRIEGVANAKEVLSKILKADKIDAVVHSMAVSDYLVDRLTTSEDIAEFIAHKLVEKEMEELRNVKFLSRFIGECIDENDRLLDKNSKVSSTIENLAIFMGRTPKLIALFKELQPDAILVGFKLLNKVGKKELLDVAYELMQKNKCDFVLANDSDQITASNHIGYLLSTDNSYVRMETKEEIATQIVKSVLALLDKRV